MDTVLAHIHLIPVPCLVNLELAEISTMASLSPRVYFVKVAEQVALFFDMQNLLFRGLNPHLILRPDHVQPRPTTGNVSSNLLIRPYLIQNQILRLLLKNKLLQNN